MPRPVLSVQINEASVPARETGRIGKVMGDCRAFDRRAPGPSREILPRRVSRIALGILHRRCVDAIRVAPASRSRPGESRSGGNKSTLADPRGDRSLRRRHEAGRRIGGVRRIDRIR